MVSKVNHWVPSLSLIAEAGIFASEAAGQIVKQVLQISGIGFWSDPFREAEFQARAAKHVHASVIVQTPSILKSLENRVIFETW